MNFLRIYKTNPGKTLYNWRKMFFVGANIRKPDKILYNQQDVAGNQQNVDIEKFGIGNIAKYLRN